MVYCYWPLGNFPNHIFVRPTRTAAVATSIHIKSYVQFQGHIIMSPVKYPKHKLMVYGKQRAQVKNDDGRRKKKPAPL